MISKYLMAFVSCTCSNNAVLQIDTVKEQFPKARPSRYYGAPPLTSTASFISAPRMSGNHHIESTHHAGSACNLHIENTIENLVRTLDVSPIDLISLEHQKGERGIFLKRNVRKNNIILRVPLSSCIRDDHPPLWYTNVPTENDDSPHHYNPSEWASRIASSLIDLELAMSKDTVTYEAKKQWLAMMPDPKILRASLPIHWPEEMVSKAKCTALEISTDSSFFSRAAAIANISERLRSIDKIDEFLKDKMVDIDTLCSNALDLVQTRSCRVESIDGIQLCPPLRVIAPIFDFINHGSSKYDGYGSANAFFGLEGEGFDQALVVRAKRDVETGQEVLIDYGDSARPAWRCLANYGFVPNYRILDPDDDVCDGADECVAELFYNGCRYEVSSHTIPTELVEAAHAIFLEEEEGVRAFEMAMNPEETSDVFPSEVALRLAKRISDAAFDLVIEHSEDKDNSNNMSQIESIAAQLAKALRWSQHQVLLACALGLRDYAAREIK